jgi:hypothetical protein
MSPEATSSQITNDVRLLVGGNFSKDALGPRYDQVLARARARPAEYLRVFESLYVSRPLNARAQSNLHLPFLLEVLRELEPVRVRQLASTLLTRYNSAAEVAEGVLEEEVAEDDTAEARPRRSSSMANRLRRRRNDLQRLAQSGARR